MSEIIEGKPVLNPGVCFICELSNPVRYIDTFRDFYGTVKERIDGRKYLCEECVEDAAKKLGFVTPKVIEEARNFARKLQNENDDLRKELEALKDLKKVVEFFGKDTVVSVKPKAKQVAKTGSASAK